MRKSNRIDCWGPRFLGILVGCTTVLFGLSEMAIAQQVDCTAVSGAFSLERSECPEDSVSPWCMTGMISGDLTGEFVSQTPSGTSAIGYGIDALTSIVVVTTFTQP